MHDVAIIVFEKRARWRPELQRELLQYSIPIRVCGSLIELRRILEQDHSAQRRTLVVLDLASGLSAVLQFLAETQSIVQSISTIILGHTAHAVLEPTLRELGASAFHRLPVRGHQLAAECLSLLELNYATQSVPQCSH